MGNGSLSFEMLFYDEDTNFDVKILHTAKDNFVKMKFSTKDIQIIWRSPEVKINKLYDQHLDKKFRTKVWYKVIISVERNEIRVDLVLNGKLKNMLNKKVFR